MSIRILLADDHRVVRDCIRKAFEQEPGMEVVAEAENGRLAVSLARRLQPDVVLMDIHMPDLNGTEATRQILSEHPGIRVVALSMYFHKQYVLRMLEAGAAGFLPKNCSFEELLLAVRTVTAGKSYLSPEVAEIVIEAAIHAARGTQRTELSLLTPRECEVLQLIAEGHSSRVIAGRLFMSKRTVESHRRDIMRKLNCHNIAELTKFAVREGLTSLDS